MSIKNESRRVNHQILEQLTTLRDEGQVQLYLLSLDARQGWQELEKRINKLKTEADQYGEKASALLKEKAHDLTQSLSDFMVKHMNHSLGLRGRGRQASWHHLERRYRALGQALGNPAVDAGVIDALSSISSGTPHKMHAAAE